MFWNKFFLLEKDLKIKFPVDQNLWENFLRFEKNSFAHLSSQLLHTLLIVGPWFADQIRHGLGLLTGSSLLRLTHFQLQQVHVIVVLLVVLGDRVDGSELRVRHDETVLVEHEEVRLGANLNRNFFFDLIPFWKMKKKYFFTNFENFFWT